MNFKVDYNKLSLPENEGVIDAQLTGTSLCDYEITRSGVCFFTFGCCHSTFGG